MPICVVANCHYTRDDVSGEKGMITFHSFPHNEEIRKKWVEFVGIENWVPKYSSVICSQHFEVSNFKDSRTLIPTAVPTIRRIKSPYCQVPGCTSKISGERRYFLRFPREETEYTKWMENIMNFEGAVEGRRKIAPDSRICLNHFENSCFTLLNGRKFLKPGSVPTLGLMGLPVHENDFKKQIPAIIKTHHNTHIIIPQCETEDSIESGEVDQSINLKSKLMQVSDCLTETQTNYKFLAKAVRKNQTSELSNANGTKKIILVKKSDIGENLNKKIVIIPRNKINLVSNPLKKRKRLEDNKNMSTIDEAIDAILREQSENEEAPQIEGFDPQNLDSNIKTELLQPIQLIPATETGPNNEKIIQISENKNGFESNESKVLPQTDQPKSSNSSFEQTDQIYVKPGEMIELPPQNVMDIISKCTSITEIYPDELYIVETDNKTCIANKSLINKYFTDFPIEKLELRDNYINSKIKYLSAKLSLSNDSKHLNEDEIKEVYEIGDLISQFMKRTPCPYCSIFIAKFTEPKFLDVVDCLKKACAMSTNLDGSTINLNFMYEYLRERIKKITRRSKLPNYVNIIIDTIVKKHVVRPTSDALTYDLDERFYEYIIKNLGPSKKKIYNNTVYCNICQIIVLELQKDDIKKKLINPLLRICNITNMYSPQEQANKMYFYLTEIIDNFPNTRMFQKLVRIIFKCHQLDFEMCCEKKKIFELVRAINNPNYEPGTMIMPNILKKTIHLGENLNENTEQHFKEPKPSTSTLSNDKKKIIKTITSKIIKIDANLLNSIKNSEKTKIVSTITSGELKKILNNEDLILKTNSDGNVVLSTENKNIPQDPLQISDDISSNNITTTSKTSKMVLKLSSQLEKVLQSAEELETTATRRKQNLAVRDEPMQHVSEGLDTAIPNENDDKTKVGGLKIKDFAKRYPSKISKRFVTRRFKFTHVKSRNVKKLKTDSHLLPVKLKKIVTRADVPQKKTVPPQKKYLPYKYKSSCTCVMCMPIIPRRIEPRTSTSKKQDEYFSDNENNLLVPLTKKTRKVSVRYVKDDDYKKDTNTRPLKYRPKRFRYDPYLLRIKNYKKLYDEKITYKVPQVMLVDIFNGKCPNKNCRITVTSRKVSKPSKTIEIDLTKDNIEVESAKSNTQNSKMETNLDVVSSQDYKVSKRVNKFHKSSPNRSINPSEEKIDREEQRNKIKTALCEANINLTETQVKLLKSFETLPPDILNRTVENIQKLLVAKKTNVEMNKMDCLPEEKVVDTGVATQNSNLKITNVFSLNDLVGSHENISKATAQNIDNEDSESTITCLSAEMEDDTIYTDVEYLDLDMEEEFQSTDANIDTNMDEVNIQTVDTDVNTAKVDTDVSTVPSSKHVSSVMEDVDHHVSTVDTSMEVVEESDTHVSTVDTKLDNVGTQIDTHLDEAKGADVQISTVDTMVTNVDTIVTNVDTHVSTVDTIQVNTHMKESKGSKIHISTVDTNVDTIHVDTQDKGDETHVSTVDQHASTIDTQVSTVDVSVSTVDTDVETNQVDTQDKGDETHVSTVDKHASTIDTQVSTVDTNVSTVDTNVESVDTTQVDTIMKEDKHESTVDTINPDMSEVDTHLSNLDISSKCVDTIHFDSDIGEVDTTIKNADTTIIEMKEVDTRLPSVDIIAKYVEYKIDKNMVEVDTVMEEVEAHVSAVDNDVDTVMMEGIESLESTTDNIVENVDIIQPVTKVDTLLTDVDTNTKDVDTSVDITDSSTYGMINNDSMNDNDLSVSDSSNVDTNVSVDKSLKKVERKSKFIKKSLRNKMLLLQRNKNLKLENKKLQERIRNLEKSLILRNSDSDS